MNENKSISPNQRTKNGSTSPDLAIKNKSPVPKVGTEARSPEMNPENRSLLLSEKYNSRKVNAKMLHPEMVSSPSLKPVRINQLIEQFEKNIVDANEDKKVKKKDAFEVLMVSGVGDTQKENSKKKVEANYKTKNYKE